MRRFRVGKWELSFIAFLTIAILLAIAHTALAYYTAVVPCASDGKGFFDGQGRILLHIVVFGFVVLVITTYLKLTGRGEMIPLIVFVGGCVILNELMDLFRSLYSNIVAVLNM